MRQCTQNVPTKTEGFSKRSSIIIIGGKCLSNLVSMEAPWHDPVAGCAQRTICTWAAAATAKLNTYKNIKKTTRDIGKKLFGSGLKESYLNWKKGIKKKEKMTKVDY